MAVLRLAENLWQKDRYRMPKQFIRRILSAFYWKILGLKDLEHIRSLYDKGAYSEAYTAVRSSMRQRPQLREDGFVYVLCADLELLANHDPWTARQLLEKAVEVGYATSAYYHRVNAKVMSALGEHEQSIEELEKCVAIDPSAPHLANLARALSARKDKRASSVWQQVLEKDPENCSAQIYAGLEAIAAGDRDKAFIMAKRAERLDLSADDSYDLGRLYLELGDSRTAIAHFLRAAELGFGDIGMLHAILACCYANIGEVEAIRNHAEIAMQCAPEDERVVHLLQGWEGWGKSGVAS
jgi:tetratricopeptide (TPR) repeat protein